MPRYLIVFLAAALATACSDSLIEGSDDVRADATNAQTPGGPDSTDTPGVVDDPTNNGAANNGGNPIGNAGPNVEPNNDPTGNNLPSPYKAWALTAGGIGNDWPQAVASDANGNVFVGGSFETPFVIDNTTISPAYGAADAFILAFDKDGEFLWHLVYGSTGADSVNDLATDDSGNVYVAGEHAGELRIGGVAKQFVGGWDAHAMKLTPQGVLAWARAFGGDREDSAEAIAVSAAGQVTVVGSYKNELAIAPFAIENEVMGGDNDIFVANFDAVTGTARWVDEMIGWGSDIGTAVTASYNGQVVVGVSTQYGLNFGASEWIGADNFTVGLVAYNSDGAILWNRHIDGGTGIALADLEIDDNGTTYAVGSFRGAVDFGTGVLDGSGKSFETWVAAYGATGEARWVDQVGGNAIDQGMGIALARDKVFAVGRFSDELYTQDQSATARGGYDIFVASYDIATGDVSALNTFGGTEDEQPGGIAFDGEQGFFVAGYTKGTFEFDGSTFAAPGQNLDAFVVRAKP